MTHSDCNKRMGIEPQTTQNCTRSSNHWATRLLWVSDSCWTLTVQQAATLLPHFEHHDSLNDMKTIFKKLKSFKKQSNSSLTITDALGTDPEPASSTSTIVKITADPMPSAVKAGHESGFSPGTHEYTCGNTRGSGSPVYTGLWGSRFEFWDGGYIAAVITFQTMPIS